MTEDRDNKVTQKQENFAQKWVEIGNASEAYRQSYEAENMSPEAIRVEACRLMQNPNVSLRILELQEDHRHRHKVTVDSLTIELEEARTIAKETKQASAAVSASMGKAKLHGLIVERNEHTGKDGAPLPSPGVTVNVTADLIKAELQKVRNEF
jgi:phage terminase small subunit